MGYWKRYIDFCEYVGCDIGNPEPIPLSEVGDWPIEKDIQPRTVEEIEARHEEVLRRKELKNKPSKRWVYFVQEPYLGLIKIGTTQYLRKRFRELQFAQCPELIFLGAIEGSFREEKFFHKAFANFRVKGEWFLPANPVLFFVKHFSERRML